LGYNLDRQIAGKIGLSGARLFFTMGKLFLFIKAIVPEKQ